ncbi:CHS_3a_G0024980.mRNA.1.CDS.1 [Saccharomyces cerevisiae]|nr:CHS_3a_G0024980.mRNA.1.CDS.1 [Saccharomyces cerevisiae]CAI7232419.1 CHS_3a_G0024980.mRNA.1.CDS.1 [Saccharomyces cerevisiae]
MVRSIVRLVEFVEGYDGFIISHEYFIYVFDAVPMLLAAIVFIVGSFLETFLPQLPSVSP